MNIIANQDKVGITKFDLYFFKFLTVLSFKKSKWLKNQVRQITKDLEAVKNRKMF